MTWPFYEDFSWLRKRVLKYRTGAEPAETLVLYSSCVSMNDKGRRLVPAGSIMCEITTGPGAGKYGPYSKTAADGRQTVGTTDQPFVLLTGKDITLGEQAIEGLWAECVFDLAVICEVNGISNNATMLAALQAAFPNSNFR
jgi:hypothetical protein